MTEKNFVTNLETSFKDEGFLTRRELGVGYGIADLVLFRPHAGNCLKRIEHKQSRRLLHEGYFRVFSSLPDIASDDAPMSLAKLGTTTAYSSGFLKYTILPYLKKAQYVKETQKGYYVKINGWLPIGLEMIAIEAKLHDWKRGFYQAHRYRVFADKVYLAVPMGIVDLVDETLLRKHGVGLIGFDARLGTKQVVLETVNKKPLDDFKRNFASEFFWSAELRGHLSAG